MFQVIISRPAERDIEAQHDWWAENRSAEQAARWHIAYLRAILDLKNHPERRPLASENGSWPFDVRQLKFGLGRRATHRAIYRIVGDQVVVLRSRHLAQNALRLDDIES
jgi:plasmid stabilization system protein ParE